MQPASTGPYPLTLAVPVVVDPPGDVRSFGWVILANLSSMACAVKTTAGSAQWLQPWSADVYDITEDGPEELTVTPNFLISSTSAAAGNLTATWWDTEPDGTYPVTLTADAISAAVSGIVDTAGSEVQLTGSPTLFTLSPTIRTFAIPAGSPPLTGLHIIIWQTAPATPTPISSLAVFGATTGAVYLPTTPVTPGGEYQVDFSSTADPGGVKVTWLSPGGGNGLQVSIIGKVQSTISRPVVANGSSGPAGFLGNVGYAAAFASSASTAFAFAGASTIRMWALALTARCSGASGAGFVADSTGTRLAVIELEGAASNDSTSLSIPGGVSIPDASAITLNATANVAADATIYFSIDQ